jgi:ABC-type transport system involved in multi-copper enzyme maturation permease subunit
MTTPTTPYRSGQSAGRDGFAQLLRAEWTKFRTVRGWVIGMAAAALLTVLVAWLGAASQNLGCIPAARTGAAGQAATRSCGPSTPAGPGGEAVTDTFYFVRQPLVGNGSITARVTSLAGVPFDGFASAQPWAKAGVIIKEGTRAGSPYAAMMATPGHGVRMQYNFTNDTAGSPAAVAAASPRWLRLTRSGDTLTGSESADGAHWSTVGTADLAGLPLTVQAGLFVASPDNSAPEGQSLGGATDIRQQPTLATAAFDNVRLQGEHPRASWTGGLINPGSVLDPQTVRRVGFTEASGRLTATGSGDIAPREGGRYAIDDVSADFGLLVVIALGVQSITTEYRRGMIRTTLTASPRRGRALAAKAVVIGCVTFAAGLAGAAVAFPLAVRLLRSGGVVDGAVMAFTGGTELRVVVGTAALLAVAAVLAVAAGAILRRSAGAVTGVIVLLVLPQILVAVLPMTPAQWLLRLTPAAAFAVQQVVPHYSQVSLACLPAADCYPLAPWAGFAVLCGYAAVVLGLAVFLLHRRDA